MRCHGSLDVLHGLAGKGMEAAHTDSLKQGLWLECGNQKIDEKLI